MTFLQLTDTHIAPGGEPAHEAVDTTANLRAALDMIEASGASATALLLTGDLAADGEPDAYQRLRGLVEPAARRIGAEVVYAMGNHDERAAFRAELLGEPEGSASPYDAVRMFGGMRVVVLDTTEPGSHDGHLEERQLRWLAEVLAVPAPLGTILVCHHPPVPSPVPSVNLLRLRGAERLAAVISGSDVRLMVTGHAHHAGCGSLAGVPVWVGPALAYGVAPVPPAGRLRADADAAFSRIDVFGGRDGQIVATAVPLSRADRVYDVAEAERLRFIESLVEAW
ncbi:metallophosphoesterase [Actinocorallia sp. B10E7]|uniref:metallophosphoesterase n=1 Tax=Actinocorallia sp. B10E7 TaxID=3153558 RepID=UPI00325ED713